MTITMNATMTHTLTLTASESVLREWMPRLELLEDAPPYTLFEVDEMADVWQLVCYSNHEQELQELAEQAAASLPLQDLPRIEPLPAVDWVVENQKAFPPLSLGQFYLYNSYQGSPQDNRLNLKLEAGAAFGTGEHATTALCLQALEQLADAGITPARVLDYGCGTGVLAMGAALLWPAASVTAADNDARAVEIAIENVETNGLGSRIQLYRTDLPNDPAIAAHAPFDLIVANILAEPLIAMAQPLVGQLARGGQLILSGILTSWADRVVAAYQAAGLVLLQTTVDNHGANPGQWVALRLQFPL
jgi:ribosomal protein L11 methyltransferase